MIRITCLALSFFVLAACRNGAQEAKDEKEHQLGFQLSSIDSSASPCNDFFQYAAGNWIVNNPIPDSEPRWGSFNILIEGNNEKIKDILDSIAKTGTLEKGSYKQLVADFYASGMDSLKVEEEGLRGLEPFFKAIDAIEDHEDFLRLMADFNKAGIRHPWNGYVGIDDKNSNAHIFHFSQSGLGMPDRDYYLESNEKYREIQSQYRNLIAEMLSLSYGVQKDEYSGEAEAIYQLEYQLAEKSMSRVDMREPEKTYNKMSYQQVLDISSGLMMDHYLSASEVKFDSAIVSQPEYLKNIGDIIGKTDIQTLKSYARWNILDNYTPYLPHRFAEADFEFSGKVLQGNKEMKPRWKRVLSSINGGLGEPMGHLFVDRYFSSTSKERIGTMIEDMRSAYRERIEVIEWMGEDTKRKAIEKLNAFNYKIGYPDKWKDYKGLEINDGSYLENAVRLARYNVQDNLDKLNEPVDKDEWFMPAHIVNAYYSSSHNEIVFPAGILQPPFYDPNAEPAVNYGGIGGVIGHEFTHGFDDKGSKYDAHGNLSNWWTKEDRTLFEERTGKMVEQYSSYEPLLEVHVNGELTLGENIADLGGLTLGYHAYKKSLEEGREEVIIDGFNWQQRIFLGWAQVWQTNQTDEYLRNQVVTDPHSPAKYRVNGPMSNMPEFRKAWGCEAGDPMVRADSLKVNIW